MFRPVWNLWIVGGHQARSYGLEGRTLKENRRAELCATCGLSKSHRSRKWKEYNRWSRAEHTDKEIMAFIRAALAELNKKAEITSLTPRHHAALTPLRCSAYAPRTPHRRRSRAVHTPLSRRSCAMLTPLSRRIDAAKARFVCVCGVMRAARINEGGGRERRGVVEKKG